MVNKYESKRNDYWSPILISIAVQAERDARMKTFKAN